MTPFLVDIATACQLNPTDRYLITTATVPVTSEITTFPPSD
jgi:hypothetical protein